MKLTPRLSCIAALTPPGARIADVGTDHGKLPIALLLSGRCACAIGTDINHGPIAHAARNAADYCVPLSLRLASGLDAVAPEECDTICIAGMGGQTISDILQAAPWTAKGGHLLLLQPMTMLYELRGWLWANGYRIEKETICREDRRLYVILSARGGAAPQFVPLADCAVSGALLGEEGAIGYIEWLLRREKRALGGMEQGNAITAPQIVHQRRVIQVLERAREELRK